MELKKISLRLGQFLCTPFMAFLMLLLCGIPPANAQTPQQIAKKALAATVLLVMEDEKGKPLGLGSGFFVDTNQIATNFHVIEGATRGTAKLVGQETEYNIEGVTALDKNHDLAILQVSVPDVQPLSLGDSDTVEIGEPVYVAGNPKGYLEGTFSDGIISAVRGNSAGKLLQMTAPISSGSSGGPVLNGSGEVIGVSFATFRDGQNLNFAIPSNYLKELVTTAGPAIPLLKGKQSISAETYLRWGIRKYKFGLYQSAIADYDKAIQLKPDYAEAYFNRGNAKYYLEQYTAAITDFDTYIHLKPDDALVYVGRGMAKARLNQYIAAIADFDAAIRLKPDYVFAYICRGNANHDLDQHFAAITDFDAAIRLDPDDAFAYVCRGVSKYKRSRTWEAKQDFQIARKLAEQAGDEDLKAHIKATVGSLY